ncbi:electron transport complex subunit RsxG [Methylophaga sp.]|uniref:electron transport complex subunit RsxG n=1 Tax=Methylophaga sp. TaxID=2024840 RepID=UPI00271C4DBA|nr:electron transport complex subunit RsxG [Methylophaga sp.]MDO8827188.1 electron transport complex subunit RsxG [Methylophaga sp.]
MKALWNQPAFRVGLMLALFAIVATTLVAYTEESTREQIKENERLALLDAINVLVPKQSYDNAILNDTIVLAPTPQLGTTEPTLVYRARKNDEPVAVVLSSVAPDGYSGSIRILIAINVDGRLSGVRVISHKETPGLGDKIDVHRDNWILQFAGLSLESPDKSRWKVKKDGGDFDQFTGATITARAVVNAIRRSLEFYEANQDKLFVPAEENR